MKNAQKIIDHIKNTTGLSVDIEYENGQMRLWKYCWCDDVEYSQLEYESIRDALREIGYRIDDPYIEHDCISGRLVAIMN